MNKQNVQEAFLEHVRKSKSPVTVFLTNGVKLQGRLTWFDDYCLTLARDGVTQLAYKHSISTVMPSDNFGVSDIMDIGNY